MSNNIASKSYQQLITIGLACLLTGFTIAAILFLAPPVTWSSLQTNAILRPQVVTVGLGSLMMLLIGTSIFFNVRGLLRYRHQR